jgi:hypothetical protein
MMGGQTSILFVVGVGVLGVRVVLERKMAATVSSYSSLFSEANYN